MAISFITAAQSPSNVVAIPATATAGDCIIVLACNPASTTFSATPTGCTTITRKAAASGSFLLAYTFKSAGSAANISAVGATRMALSVYRGTATPNPAGAFTASTAAVDSLIDLGALTFTVTDGSSWGVTGCFHNRTTGIGEPVGMVERAEALSVSIAAALADTNAGQTTFTAHTATATAARDWASITIELLALADGNRTVTAEAATYTHAGQAIVFAVGQPSAAGTYDEAGQALDFDVALTAEAGSFSLAGQSVNLMDNNPQVITAEAGAFTETGQDVQFDVIMLAEAAAYSHAGQAVTLTATGSGDTPLAASAGAYTEAGQAVALLIGMPGAAGAVTEAGQDVGLDLAMPAAAGVFVLAGEDIADYSTSAVEAPVPQVYIGAGGGHSKGEDFWLVREEYLKRLREESEEIVPHEIILEAVAQLDQGIPSVQAIAEAVAERERAYRAAEAARTTVDLNAEAARIITLTQKIAKLKMQKDEDDAILMLLMVL